MDDIFDNYIKHPKITDYVNYNFIAQPSFEQTIEQRRRYGETYWSLDVSEILPTVKSYFDEFYKRLVYECDINNLAVDGPSCCGKSSMLENFKPLKVNQFFNIQHCNAYNIYPTATISYYHINKIFARTYNTICDRSLISNLAYLITYQIMNFISNQTLTHFSLFGLCEHIIDMHNLKSFLSYIKGQKYNILIILDSDFEASAKRMNIRGRLRSSNGDIAKSLCYQYHTAQTAAFSYLANILGLACIDLNYVRKKYNVENDQEIFTSNKNMFEKHNTITNNNYTIDIEKEFTVCGSSFYKTLQQVAINISNR